MNCGFIVTARFVDVWQTPTRRCTDTGTGSSVEHFITSCHGLKCQLDHAPQQASFQPSLNIRISDVCTCRLQHDCSMKHNIRTDSSKTCHTHCAWSSLKPTTHTRLKLSTHLMLVPPQSHPQCLAPALTNTRVPKTRLMTRCCAL